MSKLQGNKVATLTDGTGHIIPIKESLTSLKYDSIGNLIYTSEDGTKTTIDSNADPSSVESKLEKLCREFGDFYWDDHTDSLERFLGTSLARGLFEDNIRDI